MTNEAGFAALPLDPRLLVAIEAQGFTEPTPIQAAAIPVMAAGKDVIGRARTGSGKTLAFILPAIQRLEGKKVVVLSPTRELAQQIADNAEPFTTALGQTIALIHGGVAYEPQIRALRKAQIVIATPGRLLDLMQKKNLDLSDTAVFVLDEADEMLRMGFIDDVTTILEACPDDRQIALFSATMPDEIRRIAERFQRDVVEVQVESKGMTTDHIEQCWMRVPQDHRLEALVRVLGGHADGATLVFARTRAECAQIADALAQRGVAADALHGDLNQGARDRLVARLRAQRLDVVIATDIAARGLDVEHITHVINLELPRDTEIYVHRIGRTGRVGRKGTAITFVTPRQVRRVQAFARQLKADIPQVEVPGDEAVRKHLRKRLTKDLLNAEEADDHSAALSWVTELVTSGWTAERIAAAALQQLAAAQGGLEGGDAGPPAWSMKVREGGVEQRTGSNEAELFLPLGRNNGVRPGDLVGAIANDTGIPGSRIGRVNIFPNKSFVGMSKEDLDAILASHSTLEIRGKEVPIKQGWGKDSGGGGRDDRSDRGSRSPHPGRKPHPGRRPHPGSRSESDRGDSSERPERAERTERPERPERPERTDRSGRYERDARSERGKRTDRDDRPAPSWKKKTPDERPAKKPWVKRDGDTAGPSSDKAKPWKKRGPPSAEVEDRPRRTGPPKKTPWKKGKDGAPDKKPWSKNKTRGRG